MLRTNQLASTQGNVLFRMKDYLYMQGVPDEFLKKLGQGYCFGFSVCRAAMRISGKLEWWDRALSLIANWDGTKDALNIRYHMPKSTQFISLEEVFERIISYIIFNHGCDVVYPYMYLRQNIFLLPGGPFEMLDAEGRLLKIKENFKIGGYFSHEDLVNIFNDKETQDLIQHNLCLIHQSDPAHTYELGYTNGMWSLYCTNFENGYPRYCFSTSSLAAELIRHDRQLVIELACVRDRKVSPFSFYYGELMKQKPLCLLQNGLIFLAWNSPELLRDLLGNLQPQEYAFINCNQIDGKYTPLYLLIHQNNLKATSAIKPLYRAGANVNLFFPSGDSPLMMAAKLKNIAAVQVLNECSADPNMISHDKTLRTALMIAVSKGDDNMIKQLLDNKNMDMWVCSPANVSYLLKEPLKSAFENYCRKYPGNVPYFTALHYAVFFAREQAVNILLTAMKEIKIETLNELWELASVLQHENIKTIIEHQLRLTLNLVKRKAESDDNERPLKKANHAINHPFFTENKNENDKLIEGYDIPKTSCG